MATKTHVLVLCAIIVAVAVPMIVKWVPPNAWYGFRTPITLSSSEIWYRANVFAGWALLVAALMSAATAWLAPGELWSRGWFPWIAVLGPLGLAVLVMVLYLQKLS